MNKIIPLTATLLIVGMGRTWACEIDSDKEKEQMFIIKAPRAKTLIIKTCRIGLEYSTDRLNVYLSGKGDLEFYMNLLQKKEVTIPADLGDLNPQQARIMASTWLDAAAGITQEAQDDMLKVQQSSFKLYTIYLKNADKPIGFIQTELVGAKQEISEDIALEYREDILKKNAVTIGYALDPDYWRQGYGVEFLNGFTTYYKTARNKNSPKVNALVAEILPSNIPSIQMAVKCNFTLFGPEVGPKGHQLYIYEFGEK